MKELLERYAALKLAIKEAEEEVKVLQPQIKELIQPDEKYDVGTAVIELSKGKSSWKYSEETTIVDTELKAKKKEEEQMGIAISVEGAPFITCNLKKS
jgi:hypothetical protein